MEIPWAPGKRSGEAVTAAAEKIAGPGGGKIGRKVAVQSAKMSLTAQLRKLEEGGRLVVVIPATEDNAKGDGSSRILMIRASVEPITASEITSPKELKAALLARTADPVQYLQHPALGYGGKSVGISQENNVETHQLHYAFINSTQTTITQFDASIETHDGNGLTKEELETVADIVKRAKLSDATIETSEPADTSTTESAE